MLNKNETFSFTLLFNDDNDKLILISEGDIPPKTEEEADTVLDSKIPEEAEIVEHIIDKISVFRDAEPGSEESVTDTLLELQNKYGISLEEDLEDGAGLDLHDETADQQHEDQFEKEKQEDGKYHELVLNDPTAILPETNYMYTNPIAYLDEEEIYYDEYTRPELAVFNTDINDVIEEEMKDLGKCSGEACKKMASVVAKVKGKNKSLCDDCYKAAKKASPKDVMIAEGAGVGEALSAFIRETRPEQKYYFEQVRDLFHKLSIFGQEEQTLILRKLTHTGNIKISFDEHGKACLERTTVNPVPRPAQVDENAISRLVNTDGNFSDVHRSLFKPKH